MAEQQAGASFNPDDASGLIDTLTGKIAAVVVDYFTTKPTDGSAPKRLVNVDVTYEGQGQKVVEHYLLGNGEEWAPNATKTGAIPVVEGKKIWNKSDVFRWVKSLVDAGFPKAQVGTDLSVFVGTEVIINRVAQEGNGATYTDKKTGQTKTRTTMLVTKILNLPKAASARGSQTRTTAAAPAQSAAPASTEGGGGNYDGQLTEIIIGALGQKGNENGLAKEKLLQPIFIAATRARLSADVRKAMQERSQSDEFLASLMEQGVISYDGATVAPASVAA